MKDKKEQSPLGNVIRKVRAGDRIVLALDGVDIGFFEMKSIPDDRAVRVACRFDRRVKIYRPKEEDSDV